MGNNGRESGNMKMMIQLCGNLNLDVDKVNNLGESILKMYRYCDWSDFEKNVREDLVDDIGSGNSEMAWLWLDTFANSGEKKLYHECISNLKSIRLLKDMTNTALDIVASFPICGECYRIILESCFIDKEKKSQQKLAVNLNLSESTVRNRKREAILLFGLALCNDKKIMNGVMNTVAVAE